MGLSAKQTVGRIARLQPWGARFRDASEAATGGQTRLLRGPQSAVPVFGGGGVSSVALAVTLTMQFGQPAFYLWTGCELALLAVRLWRARVSLRVSDFWSGNAAQICEIAGAASIGFGSAAAIATSTWIGAVLGWVAATAFAGEASVRNLANGRLVATTLVLGCAPAIVSCAVTGLPALQLAAALLGLFAYRMAKGARELNDVLIDTMRAERESDHRARHDQLTGLLNLAGFEREIELMRNDNPRAKLTLFFIDLDDFKRINDTLGHNAGDRLLRSVADRLLDLVGPSDVVARIGGDEFVVVTALDLVEPSEFAAALLAAISREDTGSGPADLPVTASIGVAHNAAHTDIAALMATADARLYAAKRAGGAQANT